MRTAVLFKTHFWDDFCDRSFEAVATCSVGCDLFISAEVSRGRFAIPRDLPVHEVSEARAAAAGLVCHPADRVFWFNGDYPLHLFFLEHGDYDYYVVVEYDVRSGVAFRSLCAGLADRNIDLVYFARSEPIASWAWTSSCDGFYEDRSVLRHGLMCISAFSRAAVAHLLQRRLAHGLQRQSSEAALSWPFHEAFVPTELMLGGFRTCDLRRLGDTGRYDWWPPMLESDIEPEAVAGAFLHPVLDAERFVVSVLSYEPQAYFDPRSIVRQKLDRLPFDFFAPHLARRLRKKGREDMAVEIERQLHALLARG